MSDISREIIEKAVAGDIEAFREIYDRTIAFVYNVALRVCGNKHDAEEISQEVFLKAHRSLKNFRFGSSFRTWIYRIAVNHAIDYSKQISKDRNMTTEYIDEAHARPAQDDIQSELRSGDRQETLIGLLKTLNPDQRACIVLRSIEGQSYSQIAATLGVGINTVRTRLLRAREKLLALAARGKEVNEHGL